MDWVVRGSVLDGNETRGHAEDVSAGRDNDVLSVAGKVGRLHRHSAAQWPPHRRRQAETASHAVPRGRTTSI